MMETVFFSRDEDGDVKILDEAGRVDHLATADYLLWGVLTRCRKELGQPESKKKSRWKTATLVEIPPNSNVVPMRRAVRVT